MRDLDRIKEKVVIRLDNRQVGLALVGLILVSIGTFAAGVMVGKSMGDAVPASLDEVDAAAVAAAEIERSSEHRRRQLALTQVSPGTRGLHDDLSGPARDPGASTPSKAARIETHRQISKARELGVTRALGPTPVGAPPAPRPPGGVAPGRGLTLVDRPPEAQRAALASPPTAAANQAYALQVSAFGNPGPAEVVAEHLRHSGHKAKVRAVTGSSGSQVYRVEVGHFAEAAAATRYQRAFEQESGYSTVLVPVR